MKQWVKTKKQNTKRKKDKIIDKSKSFEDQIKSLKKEKIWKGDYDKELKSKYFKIKLSDMSNDINEKLFKQKFGHTLIKLANKLINRQKRKSNNC